MKKPLFMSLLLVMLFFFFVGGAWAVSQTGLRVAEGAICRQVLDLACMHPNTRFDVQVGKLYCFTRIKGAENSTAVIHAWYFEGKERARVRLNVYTGNWRTYSAKIIQPHEIGVWHVDILSADGLFLQTLQFETLP